MSRRFRLATCLWLFSALALSSSAAAFVCHPDAAGTRTLAVSGHVSGYTLQGAVVHVEVEARGCPKQVFWAPLRSPSPEHAAGGGCAARTSPTVAHSVIVPTLTPRTLIATASGERATLRGATVSLYRGQTLESRFPVTVEQGARKLVLANGRLAILLGASSRLDRPARLEIYSRGGSLLHNWPLFARPATLALSGDTALFMARGGGGLYALRLSDGRTTFLGPVQPRDTPQISSAGVVFQSNLSERLNRQGRIEMKFVPASTLRADFARTFDRIRLRWPITSFSLDGPRVAIALNAPAGTCDQVRYWNIPWHFLSRITMADDLTCSNGPGMTIRSVALAGITAEWLATKDGQVKVISSDSTKCIERVIASPRSAAGTLLAADRRLLGFALPGTSTSSVGMMHVLQHDRLSFTQPRRSASSIVALTAGSGRIAALGADGRVRLVDAQGNPLATFALNDPRAIALRGTQLVALTGVRTLQMLDTTTGRSVHTWTLPAGISSAVHVAYGVAVLSDTRHVYGLNLRTGKLAVLATTPQPAQAQIDGPGVVYGYNLAGRGYMRFIPLTRIEALMR